MPTGNRQRDGFATTVSFAQAPNIALWEQDVTPPGADGGGANDTTTMRNTLWRTRQPKKLKTLTPLHLTAQYDPKIYSDIINQLNNNQLITVRFPDGATVVFYGWLDKFTPQRSREGEPPTADVTIEPSNQDNSGTEVAPVYTVPSSTTTVTTTTL